MKDTNDLQNMFNHFAPNESFVSYTKLMGLVKHQIKMYKEEQEGLEQNAEYYLYKTEKTRNEWLSLQDKIEEWQWFLELIEHRYPIITF